MNRISLKGVIIGGVVDVVGTFALSLPIGVVFGAMLAAKMAASGVHDMASSGGAQWLHNELAASGTMGHPLWWAMQVAWILPTIVAGYVAARIAGHDRVLNGAASSAVSMLLTLGAMLLLTSHAPTTEVLVETFILAPAFAALGGYLSTLGATGAPVLAE